MKIAIEQADELEKILPAQIDSVISIACNTVSNTSENFDIHNVAEIKGALDAMRYAAGSAKDDAVKYIEGLNKEDKKQLAKDFGAKTYREYEKKLETLAELTFQSIEEVNSVIAEKEWLTEKFGEGEYKDILGLCKCASRAEIAEKGYSLTPGAYVGVTPVEDDGVDFAHRMAEIHKELLALQNESNDLMATISKNMKEMGL